jgi:hypothetical protein
MVFAYLLLELVHGVAVGVGIYSEEHPTMIGHRSKHVLTLWAERAPTYAAAHNTLLSEISEGLANMWPGPIGAAVQKLGTDSNHVAIEWSDVLDEMPTKTRVALVQALAKTDAVDHLFVESDRALAEGRTDANRWHNPDDIAEIERLRRELERAQAGDYNTATGEELDDIAQIFGLRRYSDPENRRVETDDGLRRRIGVVVTKAG